MKTKNGAELWKKAKTLIPGGNQLLSKRAERFLPGLWPSYFTKAKGCEVWGVDGKKYYDFAQMGVGSCVLGYADDDINASVKKAIDDSSMCTLNCYEEVELAEKLIELHQWADMARFARTGGEACSIAVRIGRAASGRSKVAFCGYHGWQDWYLSSNIASKANLDGHLLPGLDPAGVPRELFQTALPFSYNNLEELESLISRHKDEIGVIIMEPVRNISPEPGFLQGVRDICSRIGAVLIFDEVTSGFRMNLGGIHLLEGVEPDIAVFGKALGNGFPIAAVIGRREIMESAQDTFISSTFWTERIGFVAALATLAKMKDVDLAAKLVYYGNLINEGWYRIADANNLVVDISGIPPLTHLTFRNEYSLECQTLYTQEMLDKGYLVGSSVYTTYAYSDDLINRFIEDSGEAFSLIRQALDSGDINNFLKGEKVHVGFKRLT